jgi:hypothetical protein
MRKSASGEDEMRQTMTDRWIEAAEARRVCERAMAEQIRPRLLAPTSQPLSLITKLCAMMTSNPFISAQRSPPTMRSAA